MRNPNPIHQLSLPERIYSLDVAYPLMVVGMAERHVFIYNLTNPTQVYKVRSDSQYRIKAKLEELRREWMTIKEVFGEKQC